jgi:hypothetical protein
VSDTTRHGLGKNAEAFLASGRGKTRAKGEPLKVGRSYRPLVDWQRVDLSRRDPHFTPKYRNFGMKVSRHSAHRTDPVYRTLQVACSRIEPLR